MFGYSNPDHKGELIISQARLIPPKKTLQCEISLKKHPSKINQSKCGTQKNIKYRFLLSHRIFTLKDDEIKET